MLLLSRPKIRVFQRCRLFAVINKKHIRIYGKRYPYSGSKFETHSENNISKEEMFRVGYLEIVLRDYNPQKRRFSMRHHSEMLTLPLKKESLQHERIAEWRWSFARPLTRPANFAVIRLCTGHRYRHGDYSPLQYRLWPAWFHTF